MLKIYILYRASDFFFGKVEIRCHWWQKCYNTPLVKHVVLFFEHLFLIFCVVKDKILYRRKVKT